MSCQALVTPTLFVMEPEVDFVSKLMENDPGGRNFFASCLLLLNPKELKACRLVNSVWDEFIVDEVWGKNRGRRKLEEKLVERWKTTDPMAVELSQVSGQICSMFCNDSLVFCGLASGRVSVYSLTSSEWVRDLMPGEVGPGFISFTKVSGGKAVIAAAMWGSMVTVWSSQREMEQLYHFNANNRYCLNLVCRHAGPIPCSTIVDFKVVGSKIVFLVEDFRKNKTSLVAIKRGEHIWEEKTLVCFPSNSELNNLLATDGDWVAATGQMLNSTKVMLWQDETYRQDLVLPGCLPIAAEAIALELPFLILWSSDVNVSASIKVFRLAADNGMEDISTVAFLVKSIPLYNLVPTWRGIICNKLFFGFLHAEGLAATLIEKRALVDAAVPAEKTERRQINLVDEHCSLSRLWPTMIRFTFTFTH